MNTATVAPWIAPSILSADFARLGADVDAVLAAGADIVHFDVMDNHYVPNLTIGPLVCEALRKHGVQAPIDVHLMVRPVDRIVPDFRPGRCHLHHLPPEASEHVDRTIGLIREHGLPAGPGVQPLRRRSTGSTTRSTRSTWCWLMSVNPRLRRPGLHSRRAAEDRAGTRTDRRQRPRDPP